MLHDLDRQLRLAQRDLESEMFRINTLEQAGEPFSALKCERLYRTVRALRKRKESIIHQKEVEETQLKLRKTSMPLDHSNANLDLETVLQTIGKKKDTNSFREQKEYVSPHVFMRKGTYVPDKLKLDPTIDTEVDRSFATDNYLETWTWNGRPLQLIREAKREVQWDLLREKVFQLDERLDKIEATESKENIFQPAGKVEDDWTPETKENVERGETLGENRIRARMQAKLALERQAKILHEEYMNESAISVQSVFRGHLGRKKMRDAREKYELLIKEQNIIHLQASWRGYIGRSKVKKKKAKLLHDKQQASATVIQSQYRGRVARDQLRHAKTQKERRRAAAEMIQAWWRGCIGRRQVLTLKMEYLEGIQEIVALMIQNAWRCYKARKEANRLREIQAREKQEAAAIMLQAAWRGKLARKKMVKVKQKINENEAERQSMEWSERVGKQYYSKYFLTLQQRAAIKIQNYCRCFKARKELKRLKKLAADKMLQDNIDAKLHEQESLYQLEMKKASTHDLKLVFTGQFQMPIERNTNAGGRIQDIVDVTVSVKERKDPYQLFFRVKEMNRGTIFTRAIDGLTLEKILRPLFENKRTRVDTSFELEREDAILSWVHTGKVPKRKQLISWMLDRMWIDQDQGTDEYELCLGSNVTSLGTELRNTITDMIEDQNDSYSMRQRKRNAFSDVGNTLTLQANIPDELEIETKTKTNLSINASPDKSDTENSRHPTRKAFQVFYAD